MRIRERTLAALSVLSLIQLNKSKKNNLGLFLLLLSVLFIPECPAFFHFYFVY